MVERIALHTRLKPGTEEAYADAHAHIPAELVKALKEAGVRNWRIWRSGLDLFHVVDVDNYQKMRHALADHPANVPWQASMAELLEVQDDYSGEDAGIQKVWELP
ncbi:L-rhamnose mutarotase [Pseudarthrobacter sp. PvP004]|uniref:L-rhamnose mutarotase n=1 Tax=Pseudarthrobacter sp. PvP004 TaxID=2817850 RepID=UPI001AE54D58|nr:L-rhamnose mutarotase [Pseudarthrobacter sp. PvP004]MBP2268654.1 L-rhamnose mutarotase [Pseudarthrobacter sp. PvP004]